MIRIQELVGVDGIGSIPYCVNHPNNITKCNCLSSYCAFELKDGSKDSYLSILGISFLSYDKNKVISAEYCYDYPFKICFRVWDADEKEWNIFHHMSKTLFTDQKSMLQEIAEEGKRAWKNRAFG